MNVPASPGLVRVFVRVLHARRWVAALFVCLGVLGVLGALRIPEDSSIEGLIVADDPDVRATHEFDRIFPEGKHALLMLEAPDPLSLPALQATQHLERALSHIPNLQTQSLLTLYWHGAAPAELTAAEAARIRTFATGTQLFRRAGLLGDHFLGVALELRVTTSAERDRLLTAIDAALAPYAHGAGAFTVVRRVGTPWLNAWLERETGQATARSMPLFGIFVMALALLLYRSWRTLAAIIVTLGILVAMAIGLATLFGWPHTVVSALVPLTVLVTTTATLVYIHSRYIDIPAGADPREHHARALANKFLPCTASMFATAVGFAALAVSQIRPIREMGLWTACGIAVAWLGAFTLFPALQALFRTPIGAEHEAIGSRYPRFVAAWVPITRRYRWPMVSLAILGMLAGAAALFGIPGRLAALSLQTSNVGYIDPSLPIAEDMKRFGDVSGLDVIELWLTTPTPSALDPQFLRALEELSQRIERIPGITAVDGPTSILRWARYVASGSDQLPASPAAWPDLAAQLEQIMLTEPRTRDYLDVASLQNVRLSIRGHDAAFGGPGGVRAAVERVLRDAQRTEPALSAARARIVGSGVLNDDISLRLIPTLTQSFGLTASVIFCAFLFVFRSPAARLMAMIPSVFAILAAFLVMRIAGIPLNIATVLIGSTVLGATENDQIHFFYHFQEGRAVGSTADALRHTFEVAGRPILFATLINAAGFLALTFSRLPPMRQFGIVASSAFFLALLADFTALPAALWILNVGHDSRGSVTPRARP
jgi:predicted RND superfamily exporter protein